MAPASVVHHPADLLRALGRPFELLGQLGDGCLAAQLPAKPDLGSFVVLRRANQHLGVAHGGLLVGKRPVHVDRDLPLADELEFRAAGAGEAANGLHEAKRALLEEVSLAQTAAPALGGGAFDPVQMRAE